MFLKRLFDILIAGIALIVLSPVLAAAALALKWESKAPVFYVSKRVGRGYRIFDLYKFRSMIPGSDAKLKELQHLNQYAGANRQVVTETCPDCEVTGKFCSTKLIYDKGAICENHFHRIQEAKRAGTFFKLANDPRVSPVGRFLRNTSIDELPQLLNVLKGDMSVVGNRPLPLYEAEQLTRDGASERFLAPAGLTGLWQVTKRGRKEMSEQERIDLDIRYARQWSVWFDLRILALTVPAVFQETDG